METIELRSERLNIRNLRESDLEDFHAYRCIPEVMKYQGADIMNKVEARAFIKSQEYKKYGKPGEWVQYALEDVSIKKVVGDCAIKLQEADPRIAEVGMTISHLFQRKGYAKEALLEILRFLFEVQDIHRVQEITDADNAAAAAVLKKVGFRLEGHFVENIFFKGLWGSEYQFAMLKSEWLSK